MQSRERILAALNGKDMDRIPIMEIGIWPETLERWHSEGLPQWIAPHDYLGLDKLELLAYDGSLKLKEEIIEEDDESKIFTDGDGCRYKAWKKKQGSPHLIESSVKDINDWKKLRDNLKADFSRFEEVKKEPVFGLDRDKNQCDTYKSSIDNNIFTVIVPTEPCWYYLRLLGEEEALITIALNPDFVEEIISDYNEFNIAMIESIYQKGYRFDAMWVFSDLCYKNGMLFSPKFYRERVLPYQKRFFNFCSDKGMKVIYHSDGYIKDLLPLLVEAGIDCIQPLEARAGNNVIEYGSLYADKISFMGNINADILATEKKLIFDEVSTKVSNAKETRRYLFHSDHSVPPTVSFDNYCYAIELAKKFGQY